MLFVMAIALCVAGYAMESTEQACPEFCKCVNGSVFCSGENITEIPKTFPIDTRHLEISNTRIVNATLDANMPNLESLHVHKNRFLRQFSFANSYDRLTSIKLDNNALESLRCDRALHSVTRLKVMHNKLTSVTAVTWQECKFRHIDDLDLSDNNFSSFNISPSGMCLPSLSRLYLRSSNISLFDIVTPKCHNLRFLLLPDNKLSYFTIRQKVFPQLTLLYLQRNKIAFVKCTGELEYLNSLDLKENPLKTFDYASCKFTRLSRLDLSGSLLEYFNITSRRLYMPSLRSLWIDRTPLRMLNISTLPHLTHLHATESRLQTIIYNESSPNVFKSLSLDGSSIVCDCYLLPLLRGDDVRGSCSQPKALSHVRLSNVEEIMRSTCSIKMIPSTPSPTYNSVETYETPIHSPAMKLRCTQANDRSTSLSASVHSKHMSSSTSFKSSRTVVYGGSTASSFYSAVITASSQTLSQSQFLTSVPVANYKTTEAPLKTSSSTYKYALIVTASLLAVSIVITVLLSFKLHQQISQQRHPYVEPRQQQFPQPQEPLRVASSANQTEEGTTQNHTPLHALNVTEPCYDSIDDHNQGSCSRNCSIKEVYISVKELVCLQQNLGGENNDLRESEYEVSVEACHF